MEENKRRFVKGIWIPIEIWENTELNWTERILLMEIDSFTNKEMDCFFSNEYIANILGVSETQASRTISSLIKKGYISKTRFDGRRRYVTSNLSFIVNADLTSMSRQSLGKCQGRVEVNVNHNNIINKTSNNTNKKTNKKVSVGEQELELFPTDSNKTETPLHANDEKQKETEAKKKFDEFRLAYLHAAPKGRVRGLDTEFNDFKKKYKNWQDIIPLLLPALNVEINERNAVIKEKELNKYSKAWYPQWKHLKTYLNNKSWESFLDTETKTNTEKTNNDNDDNKESGSVFQ